MLLGAVACLVTERLPAADEDAPRHKSFTELSKNNTIGVMLVVVKFAADGHAEHCRVVRSNAPFALEASTVDYIENHWKNPFFAGDTVDFPITFEQLPSYVAPWNPLTVGDPSRNLKLHLTFGPDGWVKAIQIVQPSGIDSLDQQTGMWVKVHWHHDAYANQEIDAPFQFNPPPAPPPPPPAPPVKPHPANPAPATEDTAIPAERVQ
jgi:hypothetical protein